MVPGWWDPERWQPKACSYGAQIGTDKAGQSQGTTQTPDSLLRALCTQQTGSPCIDMIRKIEVQPVLCERLWTCVSKEEEERT